MKAGRQKDLIIAEKMDDDGMDNPVDLGLKRTRSQGEPDDEDFPPMCSTSPEWEKERCRIENPLNFSD